MRLNSVKDMYPWQTPVEAKTDALANASVERFFIHLFFISQVDHLVSDTTCITLNQSQSSVEIHLQ